MLSRDRQGATNSISSLIISLSCIRITGRFSLGDVIPRHVKRNDKKAYRYPLDTGRFTFVSETEVSLGSTVTCMQDSGLNVVPYYYYYVKPEGSEADIRSSTSF